jgi:hypothetical protein
MSFEFWTNHIFIELWISLHTTFLWVLYYAVYKSLDFLLVIRLLLDKYYNCK